MTAQINLWQKVTAFFSRQSRGWLMAEAIALVIFVGVIDYVTGYEVTIFPFYSIPVILVMWFGDRSSSIFVAVLSTAAWWAADTASGHQYSREWLQIWDTIVRFMFFYLVIIAGTAVKQQRDVNRARIELLERSQKLEWEIIGISEREQQRIGRDLHDGLGQYLVAIGMAADSLKDDLEKDSLRGAGEVGKIADLLHNAVQRTRDLARGLSPVDRDEGGLEASLEDLASSASKISGIPCSFIYDGPTLVQDATRDLHLFRIAQEALSNAIKHARPKLIVIALESNDGNLSLRVSDDGIGLDQNHFKKLGIGINIMQYRANMVEGDLEIRPNLPAGTVVACTMGSTWQKNPPFKSSDNRA